MHLDIAIVGCGYVANGHIEAWRKVRNARVAAVCDLNEDLAKRTINQWSIPRYYRSLSDFVQKEKVDVVDICTPPQTHALLAVQAMQAGMNVLIEKPMTMSVEDAEKIIDCQNDTEMKAGVIHNWLFEPPVVEADSWLKDGRIGNILGIEIEILNTNADQMAANENHWSHKFPGGRISELLAHPIYLTRHFLHEEIAQVKVLASKLGKYSWIRSDELVAGFRAGRKLGTVYISLNAPRDAIFVSLNGEKGIIKFDIMNATISYLSERKTSRFSKASDSLNQANQLVKSTAKNAARILLGGWQSGHDRYIRLFADSVNRGGDPPVTVQDGYEVVKVLARMCQMIEMPQNGI